MVKTAADCSCHMSNLPSKEAEINPLVLKDECSCHGIVILRKRNIHSYKRPVTWKVTDRHLRSWFFAGYTRHLILVPKVKQLFGHLLETPWGTMKGQCFNLPKDNLHVLLTQKLLEDVDCGLYMFIYVCLLAFCLHPLISPAAFLCWEFLARNFFHGEGAGLTQNPQPGGPGFVSGLLP